MKFDWIEILHDTVSGKNSELKNSFFGSIITETESNLNFFGFYRTVPRYKIQIYRTGTVPYSSIVLCPDSFVRHYLKCTSTCTYRQINPRKMICTRVR